MDLLLLQVFEIFLRRELVVHLGLDLDCLLGLSLVDSHFSFGIRKQAQVMRQSDDGSRLVISDHECASIGIHDDGSKMKQLFTLFEFLI